jgi:hypothetical protein
MRTASKATARWTRLDLPGEDHATLVSTANGHHLSGHARFRDEPGDVDLVYSVDLTSDWSTRTAHIQGTTAGRPLSMTITTDGHGGWSVNDAPVDEVFGSVDLDLGFTPATNLISVRRLRLRVGERAEVIAAWIPYPDFRLEPLRQVYHRVTATAYAYECPALSFRSRLTVAPDGFVTAYPPLWGPR